METYTLTIPMDRLVLQATAKHLLELADSLSAPVGVRSYPVPAGMSAEEANSAVEKVLDANQVEREEPRPEAPELLLDQLAPAPDAQRVFGAGAWTAAPPAADAPPTNAPAGKTPPDPSTITGVKLANGVPWDHRIHSSGRTLYATPPFDWKRKRGVSEDAFNDVIAELKAAQAAGPAPAPPADEGPAPAPPAEAGPAPAPPAEAGPAPAPPAKINTFAELNAAVVSRKVSHDELNRAVKAVGLDVYSQVCGRPDLVPAIARGLFG